MAVDTTTQSQLELPILRWRVLAYLDFSGDVLRATSGIYDKTISGSGDAELDGSYFSISEDLIQIGAVLQRESGTDSVNVSLSGLLVNNSDLLATVGDKSLWQGRIARLWFYLVDDDENLAGEYIPFYTGFMDAISFNGDPTSQTIELTIENYISSISGASGKTYLIQSAYDAGDTSAAASISAGNGLIEGVISGGGGGGGWGDGYNGMRGMVEY